MSQNTTTTKTVSIADQIIDGGTFHMNWNTGKLERCQDHPELPKGTIIHAYGGFMSYSRWAMTGNGQECVKLSVNDADAYFSHPFHTLDKYAEPVAKKFGIGFYYDLDATPATDEEIAAAVERANAFLKEQEEKEEEARRVWEQGVADVRQKYAGIFEEKAAGSFHDAAHVAKNVRKDLALSFPGFRFSVRKGGYGEIRIAWTDGPSEDEVQAVAGKHKDIAERDRWNDDLWDHKPTYFTAVFGGVEYIWYDRTISDERAAAMASEVEGVCPATAGQGFHQSEMDKTTGAWEMYHKYELNGCNMYWYDSRSVARVVLSRMSFYQAPEKKAAKAEKKAAPAVKADGLQVVDYSEKAIAVTGNTRPVSDQLKALGGRFNARLSCGAGWIFPKRKEQEVREALGL